jgi:hypothetical protein
MSHEYVIKRGEHLAKIATDHGLSSYRATIWDAPQNAALKQKRKNPHVLNPGDSVHIPDRQIQQFSAATEVRHRFRVKRERLWLRVALEDFLGKPLAGAKCELTLDGKPIELVADGGGRIETEIPPTAQDAVLVVKDAASPLKDKRLLLRIGDLTPVEEPSGQRARLSNLGYFLGLLDDPDPRLLQSAIEEFQCDFGLTVDGKCGAKTQAKLKQVHGC